MATNQNKRGKGFSIKEAKHNAGLTTQAQEKKVSKRKSIGGMAYEETP